MSETRVASAVGERQAPQLVSIEPVLRHGNGLARVETDPLLRVPFSLPGERVEVTRVAGSEEGSLMRVLEPSSERVEPGCPHFGACGGCQLQMASAGEQLQIKCDVLLDWLARANVADLPALQVHVDKPWTYRNRVRLRVGRDETGALRVGYNARSSRRFLPVQTCPISAPLLWRAAEAMLAACSSELPSSRDLHAWISGAAEIELFADDAMESLQLLLLTENKPAGDTEFTWQRAMQALQARLPELLGAGAALLGSQPRNRERTRTPVASWGAAGLAYRVKDERYWITRGVFFQVNRFLLPDLIRLVCEGRSGVIAWDLFAGVGLFSRVLARSFTRVTAVEGSPLAAKDLQAALTKLGKQHRAVQAATLDYLREAVVQRERPDLITLDPPRAGLGEPVCELLLRLRAPEMVYVSCDPETLARDLAVLQRGYRMAALHLVDLFPQTYHQETVLVLERRA